MAKTPLVAPATVPIVPPVRRAMFLSLMWGELHLGHEVVMVISLSIELRTRAWHDGDIGFKNIWNEDFEDQQRQRKLILAQSKALEYFTSANTVVLLSHEIKPTEQLLRRLVRPNSC